jgi:xylulokinase
VASGQDRKWDELSKILQNDPAMRDAGVLGAALMAGVGSGVFSSIANAAQGFVQFDRSFSADATHTARHDDRFARYKLLYEQLKPVNTSH